MGIRVLELERMPIVESIRKVLEKGPGRRRQDSDVHGRSGNDNERILRHVLREQYRAASYGREH